MGKDKIRWEDRAGQPGGKGGTLQRDKHWERGDSRGRSENRDVE